MQPHPTTLRVSCDLLHSGVWVGQKVRVGLSVYAFSSSGLKDHVCICKISQYKQ